VLAASAIGVAAAEVHGARDGARVAQDAVVDEGSFTISRGGATVGREAFSIRRVAGAGYVATGTVVYANHRLAAVLTTDSAGAPLRYQVDARSGGAREELLIGRAARGYFSVRSQTPRGEAAREILMSPRARLLDDGIFHQWYFVLQNAPPDGGSVPVLAPRRTAEVVLHLEPATSDTVWVDGHMLRAAHVRVSAPDSITRDIWTDPAGRLLAVTEDSAGTATVVRRDELPR
jgi:hypothetical protein